MTLDLFHLSAAPNLAWWVIDNVRVGVGMPVAMPDPARSSERLIIRLA